MKFNPTEYLFKKTLSTKQVVIRILCIELMMELLIMLMFSVIPYKFDDVTEAFVDAGLLVLLTTPVIYFFVIRPFVDARDEAIVHINHLAHTDMLTKLANRRLILEYLENLVQSNARHKGFSGVLFIDLDGFKAINDEHGHDAGDAVLVEVAERLKQAVRGDDVVGRLGGDEYIVLLRKLGAEDKIARYIAQFVAYKLIKQVAEPIEVNGNSLKVGASVGIRIFGAGHTDIDKLISDADAAMYHAKENSRGGVAFYEAKT
jgi:two-component system, cell cycle response regulator